VRSVLVAKGREFDLDKCGKVEHPKGPRTDAGFNRRIQGELAFTNELAGKDQVHCVTDGRVGTIEKNVDPGHVPIDESLVLQDNTDFAQIGPPDHHLDITRISNRCFIDGGDPNPTALSPVTP